MISLVVSAALAALSKWWSGYIGGWAPLLNVANFLFDFLVITAIVAMIYKLMPSGRAHHHGHLDLLLDTDLPVGSRVHVGIRQEHLGKAPWRARAQARKLRAEPLSSVMTGTPTEDSALAQSPSGRVQPESFSAG